MYRAGVGITLLMWCARAYGAFESLYSTFPGQDVRPLANVDLTSAITGDVHDLRIGFTHTPSPFGIPQLRRSSCAISSPVSFGSAHFSILQSGFSLYSELCVRLGAMWKSGPLTVGAGLSAFRVSIRGYGSDQSLGIDLALGVDIAPTIAWTAEALNINGASLGGRKGELPQILAMRVTYAPARDMLLHIGTTKDIRFPTEVRFGFFYVPVPVLVVICSVSTNPSAFEAGLQIGLWGAELGYGVSVHSVLGLTHRFGIVLIPSSW